MAKVVVHAGDFKKGKGHRFMLGQLIMETDEMGWTGFKTETILVKEIEDLDVASEEAVKKVWGTAASGAAGALLLGPLGLLTGVLVGGRKNMITFVCRFKDGRRMMAETDSKTFKRIQAELF